jgi:hypothetical protein
MADESSESRYDATAPMFRCRRIAVSSDPRAGFGTGLVGE